MIYDKDIIEALKPEADTTVKNLTDALEDGDVMDFLLDYFFDEERDPEREEMTANEIELLDAVDHCYGWLREMPEDLPASKIDYSPEDLYERSIYSYAS